MKMLKIVLLICSQCLAFTTATTVESTVEITTEGTTFLFCPPDCSICSSPFNCDDCKVGFGVTRAGLCEHCSICSSPFNCDDCKVGFGVTRAGLCEPLTTEAEITRGLSESISSAETSAPLLSSSSSSLPSTLSSSSSSVEILSSSTGTTTEDNQGLSLWKILLIILGAVGGLILLIVAARCLVNCVTSPVQTISTPSGGQYNPVRVGINEYYAAQRRPELWAPQRNRQRSIGRPLFTSISAPRYYPGFSGWT